MSYKRTIWQTGDEITALKLNNLENGVEEALTAAATEVLPEQDVAFSPFGSAYTADGVTLSEPISIGEYYTVYWNGSVHTCKCMYGTETGGATIKDPILGNLRFLDSTVPNTGEPFLMLISDTLWIYTDEPGEKQRIGIFSVKQVIPEQIKAEVADNGKFLRVVNGKAAWVNISQAENTSF